MRPLWVVLVLLALVSGAAAGQVTLTLVDIQNYGGVEGWRGQIRATSTVPWPGFHPKQTVTLPQTLQAVAASGLMIYRCQRDTEGGDPGGCGPGDPDVHTFVTTGRDPKFAYLTGSAVKVSDRVKGNGLFERTWIWQKGVGNFLATEREDSFPPSGGALLGPFFDTLAELGAFVFPVGFRLTVHLADLDTISQMLSGTPLSFAFPLAHRESLPCVPLRFDSQGEVSSTQCRFP